MQYLEDFTLNKTISLGGYQLTASEIIEFGTRYDPQYYHTNPHQAKASLFGGLIASGWQVAAIWMKLYVETMLTQAAVEGSPGVQQINWLEPVRPGDLLLGRITITQATPSLSRSDCGILHNRGELLNAEGKIVMQLILYSLFKKRPAQIRDLSNKTHH